MWAECKCAVVVELVADETRPPTDGEKVLGLWKGNSWIFEYITLYNVQAEADPGVT